MSNNSIFFKNALIFGVLCGSMLSFITFILFYTNFNFIENLAYLPYLAVLSTYFSTKKYRNDAMNGIISFWRAYLFSVLTIIIAIALYNIYYYIHLKFINPSLVDSYFELYMDLLKQQYQDKSLHDMFSIVYKQLPIGINLLMNIFNYLFISLLMLLPISAIIKKI